MDYLRQRFFDAAERITKAANEIKNALVGLQQSVAAIRDQHERDQESAEAQQRLLQPPIQVQAEVREPPALAGQRRTNENRQFWVQVALAVATSLAFLAAACYARIATK